MKSVTQKLHNVVHYREEFKNWIATEMIINETQAIWSLQNPLIKTQRITMYRDNYKVFIYGDYGTVIFDQMTWIATPHDLRYDDMGYQSEKLDPNNRKNLTVFDQTECIEDIVYWLYIAVRNLLSDQDIEMHKLAPDVQTNLTYFIEHYNENNTEDDINEFCETNQLEELKDLFIFAKEHLSQYVEDEEDYVDFLTRHTSHLEEFDRLGNQSDLFNAGQTLNQNYYLNLFAMQICSEKLNQKEN